MNQPFVQIFILSRNRLDYLKESLQSCLAQHYENYEVIVSDNSTEPEIKNFLEKFAKNDKLKVVYRNNLSYTDHTNLILSEVAATYFMMFHDDDILLPNCLSDYIKIMNSNSDLSAVGGNSYIIKDKMHTNILFMRNAQDSMMKNSRDFFRNYLLHTSSHPAFPTFLYRSNCVQSIKLAPFKGGGYSDTSFLFEAVNNGPIYISTSIIAKYRMHGKNMSSQINIYHINKLVKYLSANAPEDLNLLLSYKYTIWIKYLLRHPQRRLMGFTSKVIFWNAFKFFVCCPKYLIVRVVSKLFRLIAVKMR